MADKIDQNRKGDDQLDDEFGSMGGFDDLSLDDPFGDLEGPSKGRKPDSPAKEMLISGLQGAGQGLQSGFKSELYKAMPNLEPVVGEVTDSFNEFRDLKDEVGKKLAPMITTLETSARKILPKAQAFIPKGMYEKIKGKLDERAEQRAAEAGYTQSKEQQEAEYISQSLNEIFSAQMESQQASDLAEEQRHLADQAVEAERHEKTLAASGHVYESVRATELFHKTIHTAYMKKSLELKYKHLFIAKDTYNLLAESLKSFNAYFQAIQKNTMLPDMAKVEIGDYHRKAMTQKYGELMSNFMSGFRKKIFDGIKKKVLGGISALGDTVDMLGQGTEMAEMASEMGGGPSMKGMAAQGGGWLLGKLGGSPVFRKLAQKYAPILKQADKGVGGFAQSLALKGANLKRNWEASDSRVLQFFADFLPGLTPQTSGSNDLVDRGEKPATFDTMTRQSIVEIIPGYLSKILHSVDILRTGDENTQQQVYNVYSRKFSTVEELKEGYYDKLYGAETTRRGVFEDALSTLQAGVTANKTTEDPKAFYKKYEKDINRFLINHAIKAQFLDLPKIGDYLTRTDNSFISQYIRDITQGFENPADDVLRAIYQGCLAEDGDVDKNLVQDLEESINAYRKMDSFKTEMPRLFELYGYRSYLSDKIGTKEKAALEKQVRTSREVEGLQKLVKTDADEAELKKAIKSDKELAELQTKADAGDEEAKKAIDASNQAKSDLEKSQDAKKQIEDSARAKTRLAATAGIIGDNNGFNLQHLVDTQADIDYGGVDTTYGVKARLGELETAKEAAAQIAELKEKTGYNRIRQWTGEKIDQASAYGRKIMDRAKGKFDETKTFLSDIASNFSQFASRIVTDPIYRAGILADLEAKGTDLLAAGKAGGQKIMDLAKEIREDPKAAMEKLRAASKEKFEEIKDAVVDKAEQASAAVKKAYVENVSEETRDKISKGVDKATGAVKAASAAIGKAVEEHTPEGVKKAVKTVADHIPTSKEEVSQLVTTAKDAIVDAAKKIPTDKEGLAEAARSVSETVSKKVSEVSEAIKKTVDEHTPEAVKKGAKKAAEAASSGVQTIKKKFTGDDTPPAPPVPPAPPPPDEGGGGGGTTVTATIDDGTISLLREFMDSCRSTLKNLETSQTNISAILDNAFREGAGKTGNIIDAINRVNQSIIDSRPASADTTLAAELPSTVTDENASLLKQLLEEYKFQSEFRTEQLDEWKKANSEEMGILFDTMAEWKGSQEQLLAALTEKVGSIGGGGGGDGGGGNGFNHEALISALEQGGYIKKRGMLQMLGGGIKSVAGAAGKVAKGAAKYAGTVYAGALKGAGMALKGAFGFAGNVVNKAAKAAKWMVEKPTFVDIYRKGEEGGAPLVSARMQREDPGVVFADNGERVKASKDINRPIKDPRTGNYLITPEDLEHGLSMPDGSPIGKLLGGAASVLKSYFGFYGAVAVGALKFAGKAVGAISAGIFGKKAEPYCDIYIKGKMDKPVLTRLKQERDPGVVFKDGTRVKYSSDIHEPVYDPVEKDAAGVNKMLISEEDIKTGLVDANGKRLSMNAGTKGLIGATAGAIEKLVPFLGKGLKGAGGLYATVFKGLFGLGMGAAKGVGKILGRVFGLNVGGTGGDADKELLTAVQKIRDDVALIAADKKHKSGDADGDGDVDGTYADQQQNADKEKSSPTFAEHVDVNYRKKAGEAAEAAAAGAGGSAMWNKAKKWISDKLGNTKYGKMVKGWFEGAKGWTKGILKGFGNKLGGFTKTLGGKLGGMLKGLGSHLGSFTKLLGGKLGGLLKGLGGHLGKIPSLLGKIPGLGKIGGLLGKIPGLGKIGGLAAKAGGLVSKIPGVAGLAAKAGSLFGLGGAGGAAGAGGALAGIGGTLASVAGPAALAALAGYGIYRGVKGFSKKNTLENVGQSEGISKESQLTGEDRMYSALGLNSKIGAKTVKFLSQGLGLHGLIKGIRGNDNPLTDKEIETGRTKLQRKIDKGMPGYDRILQEYEKAVEAGNWRRARELSGQEADGLIKSLWKNSWTGKLVTGMGNIFFGKKDEEMNESEIKKTRDKFNSIIAKGGTKGKAAEKLLSKFEDYVSEGDWKNARKIAGMEKRGLFGKLFQDSKGNIKWGSAIGYALGGPVGLLVGSLFNKTDKNAPMDDKEIETERNRLQKLAEGGNKAAEKILAKFDEAVTEQDWKKARMLCGKEVKSNIAKLGSAVKTGAKWWARVSTLGLSMLLESDQDKPLTEQEISAYQKKMTARASHGDKMAEKKLDKFNEAVAKQDWAKARAISKMKDEMAITKAAKATWHFFFGGSGEEPMKEAEITKFRESMQRKINMGSKAAEKKLEAFNQAVEEERWKKARAISRTPDEGVLKKGAKALASFTANNWRFLLGGDGKPMDESELQAARKQFQIDVAEGKKGAQKRFDMFEDYVADEKWEKARKLAKMPYENIAKRALKSVGNFLFGDDKEAMTPEEVDKFQKEMEQKVEDGVPGAQKQLDAFNHAVEIENWKKARAISKVKAGGVVGSIKNAAKSVWNFFTGKKDYEDCMKRKEDLEEKASEDETGLVDAGITKFETLVRRQKYNEAMDLADDIMKLKPHELAMKHKLSSDNYEEMKKQAVDLNNKINKAIEKDNSWFSIKKMRLKMLRSDVMNSGEWSDEYFEDLRDRYSQITGEDVFGADAENVDEETMKRGKQLLRDIDDTSNNFSWLGSPIVKSRLASLRSEVKSDLSAWDDEHFDEWRDKIKEIAGDDAVITLPPELEQDKYADKETLTKGRKLLTKLQEMKDEYSWWTSPLIKKNLQGLYDQLKGDPSSWSDETFKNIMQQAEEITGKKAEDIENEINQDNSWKDAQRADREGRQVLKDIDATANKFNWFTSPRIKWNLSRLRSQVEGEEMQWGKGDTIEKYRERLKEIAGEDAVLTELPEDDAEWEKRERIEKQGQQVIKDIKATSNNFSWIGSPKVKWNLSRLLSQVEGEETKWDPKRIQMYRERIKAIAGDEAVVTVNEEDMDEKEKAAYERSNWIEEQGKQVIKDIDETKDKFSWLTSPRIKWKLSRLQSQVEGERGEWSEARLKSYQDRLKEIAGDDAVITDVEKPESMTKQEDKEVAESNWIDEQGKQILKDIDDTKDKFSWFSSPRIKWKLSRLRSQVEGEEAEWSEEKFKQYQDRIKEIAGDDAVLTTIEKPKKEEENEEEEEGEAVDVSKFLGSKEEEAAKLQGMKKQELMDNLDDLKDKIMKSCIGLNANSPEVARMDELVFKISKLQNRADVIGPGANPRLAAEILRKGTTEIQEEWREILKSAKKMGNKKLKKDQGDAAQDKLTENGETILKDIDATKDKFSWFTSPRIKWKLSRLKSQVEGERGEWSDDKFKFYQDQLKEIAGEDAVVSELEKSDGDSKENEEMTEANWVDKQGQQVLKDIDDTKDKFSWLTSPRIKWKLSRLKSRVEGEQGEWTEEKLQEYQNSIRDIAGDDAVVTEIEKPKKEGKEDEEMTEANWIDKQGKQVIKDIDETKDKFSWITSPRIKWKLSRLKSRVEGEEGEWTEDKLKEYQDQIKDIAGDDAVVTEIEKPKKEAEESEAKDSLDVSTHEELVKKLTSLKMKIVKQLKAMPDNDNRASPLEKLLIKVTKKLNLQNIDNEITAEVVRDFLKKYEEIMGEPAFEEDKSSGDDGSTEERTIEQRGNDLINDIEDTKSKLKWYDTSNWELSSLKRKLSWEKDMWTKESIDKAREKYREIIKENNISGAKDSDAEAEEKDMDPTILAKGKSLLDDIADTKKEFHWWNSENQQLDALRQNIEGKKLEWDDENLKDFKKKFKEIAGDKAKDSFNFDAEDQDLERRGRQLVKDVGETMNKLGENDFFKSLWNSGELDKLKTLKQHIESNYSEWSDDKLKKWQDQLKEIAGDAAVLSDMSRKDKEEEDDGDLDIDLETNVVEQLEKLQKEAGDAEKGLNITDPKVKQLDDLIAEISHLKNSPDQHNDETPIKVAKLRKKLDKILGRVKKDESEELEAKNQELSDAVNNPDPAAGNEPIAAEEEKEPEPGYVNPLAEEHYGKERIKKEPWLAMVDHPGDPDDERDAKEAWELEQSGKKMIDRSSASESTMTTTSGVKIAGAVVGDQLTKTQYNFIKSALKMDPDYLDTLPLDVQSKYYNYKEGGETAAAAPAAAAPAATPVAEEASAATPAPDNSQQEAEDRESMRRLRQEGPIAAPRLTKKQYQAIKAMVDEDPSYLDSLEPGLQQAYKDFDFMERKKAARKADDQFEQRFAFGGFFKKGLSKLGKFAGKALDPFGIYGKTAKIIGDGAGAFINKAKEAIVGNNVLSQIGEAGTEAIVPIRNKAGNLLSKLGDKVNAILHGQPIGPANDVKTDDGVVHAEDGASEPTTNLMAKELSENITPAPKINDSKPESGSWLDSITDKFTNWFKKETPPAAQEKSASESSAETTQNFSELLKQNQQLIALLTSVISDKGLRVDGMGDLASAISNMPAEGDTNNVSFNDNNGGPQTGFDLRKKQV